MSMTRRELLRSGGLAVAGGLFSLSACSAPPSATAAVPKTGKEAESFEIVRTDAQWRQRLTPEQYYVLRQEGTERPYSHPLNKEHRKGTFACAGCELPLFSSVTKFESHTGWPSFYKPLPQAVGETRDVSLGMVRTEVHCRRCGGHLGHVFRDGPRPTGLRYCMNGAALTFTPA